MFMKIDPHILKFPNSLPNDEQDFMIYYPYKFPKVIDFFEEKAQALYNKPDAYEKFVQDQFKELEAAVNKVNDEYQKGDQTDLAFLVRIDQKFNKLFCFKFWVINYVFADGLIHEFYVDQLKAFARKMVDVTDDVEEYEQRVIKIQRDLLQTDYADIYLVQALHGVIVMKFLEQDEFAKKILDQVIPLLDEHDDKNNAKILELWKPLVDKILDENNHDYDELTAYPDDFGEKYKTLLDLPPLELPTNQVRMRKSPFPLYSFLNHAVEFRQQNIDLQARYENMKQTIEDIFVEARGKLSEEEYTDFKLSYDMARNFSMSKDIMGNVDPILVPVWARELPKKICEILSKTQKVNYSSATYTAMFRSFVWYLPEDLKAEVMSVDNTPFNIDEL